MLLLIRMVIVAASNSRTASGAIYRISLEKVPCGRVRKPRPKTPIFFFEIFLFDAVMIVISGHFDHSETFVSAHGQHIHQLVSCMFFRNNFSFLISHNYIEIVRPLAYIQGDMSLRS